MIWIILLFALACFIGALAWRRVWRSCEQANRADWGHRWLNRIDGLVRIFCRKYHRLNFVDIPLPEQGGAVVVANHISGLDPLLMLTASRRPLRFLIAEEEYRRIGLRWLFKKAGCIPVDRHKRPADALRKAIKHLQAGEVIALFPHGRIHREQSAGKIKGGAVRLAQKANTPIYPLWLNGVRGRGFTFLALLLRSRATLTTLKPIDCQQSDYHDCIEQLTRALNKF